MLKKLVKIANRLDVLGLRKEADELDRIINKYSKEWWETGVLPLGLSENLFASESQWCETNDGRFGRCVEFDRDENHLRFSDCVALPVLCCLV